MMGHFSRDNLIKYDADIPLAIRLTRLDTNESVDVAIDSSSVPGNPAMKPLMAKSLQGLASQEEKNEFKKLWQQRVEAMLVNDALWEQMITIQKG
jgi:hypothetical protein